MEILALILLVVLLVFGYPWYQDRRERQLAERLERLREAGVASVEVDAAIAQSKREADTLSRLGGHRF
jgi:hypothetical protein